MPPLSLRRLPSTRGELPFTRPRAGGGAVAVAAFAGVTAPGRAVATGAASAAARARLAVRPPRPHLPPLAPPWREAARFAARSTAAVARSLAAAPARRALPTRPPQSAARGAAPPRTTAWTSARPRRAVPAKAATRAHPSPDHACRLPAPLAGSGARPASRAGPVETRGRAPPPGSLSPPSVARPPRSRGNRRASELEPTRGAPTCCH